MAQPKQKPISKRPSRLASSLLAAKIALGSAVPTPQTSQIRPDEIANRLAADRAQSAGLRSAQTPDDFDEAEEDIPDFEDESAKTALTPDNLTAAQRSQTQQEQQKKNQAASQQQLDAQQQADVAAQMEAGKQRATAQTQQEINKLDQEINKLQEDLTSFRDNISLKKILSYRPNITILINQIIDQLKKKAANLTDEGKIKFYQGVIPLLSMLLGMLRDRKSVV